MSLSFIQEHLCSKMVATWCSTITYRNVCAEKWLQHGPHCVQKRLCNKMVATWPSTLYRTAREAKWLQNVPHLCTGMPVQQNGCNMALNYNVKECLRSKMVATCPSTLYRNESRKGLSVENSR